MEHLKEEAAATEVVAGRVSAHQITAHLSGRLRLNHVFPAAARGTEVSPVHFAMAQDGACRHRVTSATAEASVSA